MNFSDLFAISFIVGSVLAVISMFIGVVRPPSVDIPEIPRGTGPFVSRERLIAAASELSARYHLPIFAAFTFLFGLVGYALSRFTQLGAVTLLVIAGVAGGGFAVFTAALVARWALPTARADLPDERYLLQGHFAEVLKDVAGESPGLISLEINGVRHTAPAVSLAGDNIVAGTEVVIERIEADVAIVEPWSAVEQRL